MLAKLFRYVKEEYDGRFAKVHTINRKIIMKETSDENDNDDKSDEIGNAMWLKIETPDDLRRYGVDIDFLCYAFLIIVLTKANLPKKLCN